ncbi:hypothetical protein FVA81_03360 (plasmid) [Rhizobium sp. WL3]|uniref:capsular polysaccharide export protein, LipB/KpsS family n=1 Tax=Rhizobium sp. WL3 TaxID=2603277 RepID=UPI0011C20A8E|nr:hypothetical protein [Rhizobium sp. WL3]QEE43674.1 hypothetical protein FVA81_03360 [Rhizobium sp. WL3]
MKRLFYIECSGQIWRDIALLCQQKADWEPILWTASHDQRGAVLKVFPNVSFVAGPDAALGLQHENSIWRIFPPSVEMLTALAPAESIALHMMDRMDPGCGGGFPHDARRRHWHSLLAWWNAAIDNLQPDQIIFSIAPHVVFDYALLAVARYRKIPTVMFERLGLPGWVFPMADYETGSPALRSALTPAATSGDLEEMPEAFRIWLERSLGGGEAVPANFQKKLERYRLRKDQSLPSLSRSIVHELKRAVVLFLRNGFQPAPNSYLRSAHWPHERAGPLETLTSRISGVFAKRKLIRLHDKLARQPDAGDDYVFLALHYQPERATVPMGGVFGDQLLIVDTLVAALPAGWKLYVKEHPWQLQPFGRGEVQRSAEFYNRLRRHPQVVLIPRGEETKALVRGAKAVATVTGSVGWDALCARIPVLLFGAAWYRDCPGAYSVVAIADLKAEFQLIRGGKRPTVEGVRRFCHALAKVCVPGVLEPELESADHVSHSEASANMAKVLLERPSDAP